MFTGPEADMQACRRIKSGQVVNEDWQFECLDRLGRVVVMKYHGIEVALFMKRQITEVEPLPCDPLPEGIIKDPRDAWVRIDLLGASARQVCSRVGREKRELQEQLELTEKQLAIKKQLLDEAEIALRKVRQRVDVLEAELHEARSNSRKVVAA